MLCESKLISKVMDDILTNIDIHVTYEISNNNNPFPYSIPSKSHIVFNPSILPLLAFSYAIGDCCKELNEILKIHEGRLDDVFLELLELEMSCIAQEYHLYNLLLLAARNDCTDEVQALSTAMLPKLKPLTNTCKKIEITELEHYIKFIALHEIGHILFYKDIDRRDKYIELEKLKLEKDIKWRFEQRKNVQKVKFEGSSNGTEYSYEQYMYNDILIGDLPDDVTDDINRVKTIYYKKAEEFSADDFAIDYFMQHTNKKELENLHSSILNVLPFISNYPVYYYSMLNEKFNLSNLLINYYDVDKKYNNLKKFSENRIRNMITTFSEKYGIEMPNDNLCLNYTNLYDSIFYLGKESSYFDIYKCILEGNLNILNEQSHKQIKDTISMLNKEILSCFVLY